MAGGPELRPGMHNEVVLITGCSEGSIGAALAFTFSEAEFTVVATSRSLETMKLFEGHQHIEKLVLDLTAPESIKEAVEYVVKTYGRIDILVNNAGVSCISPVAETTMPVVHNVYQTNLFGPIMLIQAVVPHMVARGKGKIVNVSSIVAYAAGPWYGIYGGSKAAFHAISDALRMELKPFNIDVIVVAPGAVNSEIGKKAAAHVRSYVSSLQIYKPFETYLLNRKMLSENAKATPTAVFAEKAVRAITKKSPPAYFTYGYLSRTYLFLYFCASWFRDWWFAEQMPNVVECKKRV